MTRKPVVATLIVVALTIMVAVGAAITPSGEASSGHASPNGLVGAWTQTVILPAPLPPLRSIQVFNRGGTAVETSSEPPATRSPMLSTWKHLGGRLYAATGEHFIFNPQTGALQGTRKINRTIDVAQDGQSYATVARVTTFDPLGNVVATFVARATAERMQLEPIPDLP
jgi:hypothetical protein